jgi:predicted AlkP superfamily phosphohydrolase/phosphomutase/tetratricopeptide (TPR) repeat protein
MPGFFFALVLESQGMPKRLTRRVLLIGWDAADWNIIHPLIEAGKMPILKRFVESGISGKIATLQPVLSPILWTSIATGKRADKHDILGFVEPSPDGKGIRPVTSTSRKCKAIWNILSQSGLRSTVINWFASHPAEPIAGNILTNRFASVMARDGKRLPLPPDAVHPPELLELAESFRVHPVEITIQQMLAFFPDAVPADKSDSRLGMLAGLLAQCATTQNAAAHFAAEEDWDLLAIYFDAIDHAGHVFMEYHPPAMPHVSAEDATAFGGVITGVYRFHDMLLGRLLDLVGPDTTVMILSDHGFYHDQLRPQVQEHFSDPKKKFGTEMNPVSWHRLQGVFAAAGQAIKRDELFYGMNLLDIAPTILALLGLPIPDDMDGRALTGIFSDPVELEHIASYEPPHENDGIRRNVTTEETDPWGARQALEQLAALGYINLPEGDSPQEAIDRTRRDRLNNLAQVYFSSGRVNKALEILQQFLAKEDSTHLRCRVALCLLGLGKFEEADKIMAGLVEKGQKGPLVRLTYGQIKLAQNQVDEALALLEPLQEESFPLSYLHTTLGQAYLRGRLYKNAEASFRRAIERDEDNAEAHDGLGVALRRQGIYEDAVYEHTRAATLQHHRPQTHLNLGIALAMSQQFDWAISAFSVAAELAPENPNPHRWLTKLYRRVKKDDEKAREHVRIWLQLRKQAMEKSRKEIAVAFPSQ